jgi:hypothetical protein
MASGPAIDEQYNTPRRGTVEKSETAAQGASGGSSLLPDPGDVDFDPNDLAPSGSGSTAVAQPSRPNQMMDWDDLDDDEEEFYSR